ncbi:MAG TPA: HD domain-containing phosphohydrolase, partial [Acidobacteriota bacterium]|nr:HD domain-containing phosphohydrolase [Acidobacteriota bacterium]
MISPALLNILIVEDDPSIRLLLERTLSRHGYSCAPAASASEALRLMQEREFQVTLVDIILPEMTGLELIPRLKRLDSYLEIVVITGVQERQTAIDALKAGARDYIVKPFDLETVLRTVKLAISERELSILQSTYQTRLEERVLEQTDKLQSTVRLLRRSYDGTIHALAKALTIRDAETAEHAERVVEYTRILAQEIGYHKDSTKAARELSTSRFDDLIRGAILHDIGKIGVPDYILRKPGPLTDEEWRLMRRHPLIGAEIIRNIPFLEGAAPVIRHHHERWDGQGYPDGLAGNDIPLSARLFAVADAFDAMIS